MTLSTNSATDLFNEACQQLIGIKHSTPKGVWRHVLSSLTDEKRKDIAQQIGVNTITHDDLKTAFQDTTQFNKLRRFDVDLFERTKLSNGSRTANLLSSLIKKTYCRSLEAASKSNPAENINDILIEVAEVVLPIDQKYELNFVTKDPKGGERLKDFILHILPDYFNEEQREIYRRYKSKITSDAFELSKLKFPK